MKTKHFRTLLTLLLAGIFLTYGFTAFAAEAGKVFFSAYVEGSSNNKAVSIFNGYGVDLDLTNYEVWIYSNGNTSTSAEITLNGTLAPGEIFVLANSSADTELLALADMTSGSLTFNGNDAVALIQLEDQSNTLIEEPMDIIGRIGEDPGSEWSGGGVGTQNETLYRDETVTVGDMDGSDAFDPSAEWTSAAQDTFTGIDTFTPDGWTPNAITLSNLNAISPILSLSGALVLAGAVVVLRKRR